jgi:RNA polymerase primary sigma factor
MWHIDENPNLSIYFKDIAGSKKLTKKEEFDLFNKIKKGNKKAEGDLIKANLRFVIRVAKNYLNQGIDLSDLISIGNMGLIRAAQLYDGNRNFKFISYAVWWIRQGIIGALAEQSRAIKIPMSVVSRLYKMRKIRDNLIKQRDPVDIFDIANCMKTTENSVKELLDLENRTTYLNSPINDDGGELIDIMSAEEDPPDNGHFVREILENLPERERDIIKSYYGVDCVPMTLLELANQYSITRERIRQIKLMALRRARTSLKFKAYSYN